MASDLLAVPEFREIEVAFMDINPRNLDMVYQLCQRDIEENGLSFEHMPTGIDTMSVIVATADIDPIREKLIASLNRTLKPDSITVDDGLALIAVVGRGMVKAKGTASRIVSAVSSADVNIPMIDQGSSELNVIIGVDESSFTRAIKAIYKEFCN